MDQLYLQMSSSLAQRTYLKYKFLSTKLKLLLGIYNLYRSPGIFVIQYCSYYNNTIDKIIVLN